jgi:hypothetical protein
VNLFNLSAATVMLAKVNVSFGDNDSSISGNPGMRVSC